MSPLVAGLLIVSGLISLAVDAVKLIEQAIHLSRRTYRATVRRFGQADMQEEAE